MTVDVGSQCWLCDLPIRYDNYHGCSHGCRYCFVQRGGKHKYLTDIKDESGINQLINFINGKRTKQVGWCDWNIPIHWGGGAFPTRFSQSKRNTERRCKC